MTRVVVKEINNARLIYQRALQQVGEGNAAKAFSRAMNHEGKKTFTKVKRVLRKQTDIPRDHIEAGTKFVRSSPGNLKTIIEGTGRHLPLRLFNARQFSFGVRAKVWGKHQRFPSAFIIAKYNGGVYKRLTKKRFPIKQLYGPSIPVEIVKDATADTFLNSAADVSARAMHELARILKI